MDVDCVFAHKAEGRKGGFESSVIQRVCEVETCPMGQFETSFEICKHSGDTGLEIRGDRGGCENRAILEVRGEKSCVRFGAENE